MHHLRLPQRSAIRFATAAKVDASFSWLNHWRQPQMAVGVPGSTASADLRQPQRSDSFIRSLALVISFKDRS